MELLFLPGLPSVGRGPGFLDGTGQLAMQRISEFDPNDVIPEGLAIDDGSDLRPVLASIGRVEKGARRASYPDVKTSGIEGSKNRAA